jgi:hypothetical protein
MIQFSIPKHIPQIIIIAIIVLLKAGKSSESYVVEMTPDQYSIQFGAYIA